MNKRGSLVFIRRIIEFYNEKLGVKRVLRRSLGYFPFYILGLYAIVMPLVIVAFDNNLYLGILYAVGVIGIVVFIDRDVKNKPLLIRKNNLDLIETFLRNDFEIDTIEKLKALERYLIKELPIRKVSLFSSSGLSQQFFVSAVTITLLSLVVQNFTSNPEFAGQMLAIYIIVAIVTVVLVNMASNVLFLFSQYSKLQHFTSLLSELILSKEIENDPHLISSNQLDGDSFRASDSNEEITLSN